MKEINLIFKNSK